MSTIVVDENIALGREAFSGLGKVELLPGRRIDKKSLLYADALIVRSITRVGEELLDGTPVKFVGTATIGTDHIDTGYLASAGIKFADAKGCNADAVTEYVFAAIFNILALKKIASFENLTLGVIGLGNIGSRVAKVGEILGLKVLKNDPPLQRISGRNDFVSFEEILNSDIVTLHVPLNMEGKDKTFHLMDSGKLSRLKENCILINSSRGAVVDNAALKEALNEKMFTVVLDVWENEPMIDPGLLKKIEIGTPHIAGYSFEGKLNGTIMIYTALAEFLRAPNRKEEWLSFSPELKDRIMRYEDSGNIVQQLTDILDQVYNIRKDDAELRKIISLTLNQLGSHFDSLRRNYPLRRELCNYTVRLKRRNPKLEKILKMLRINIELI